MSIALFQDRVTHRTYNGTVSLDDEVEFSTSALDRVGISRVFSPMFGNIAYMKNRLDRSVVPIMRYHDTWIARLLLATEQGMKEKEQIDLLPLRMDQESRLWRPARERSDRQVMLG